MGTMEVVKQATGFSCMTSGVTLSQSVGGQSVVVYDSLVWRRSCDRTTWEHIKQALPTTWEEREVFGRVEGRRHPSRFTILVPKGTMVEVNYSVGPIPME